MPSTIDSVGSGPNTGAVTYIARYTKLDGTPGDVQTPPVVTLSDPTLGTLRSFPSTEKGVFEFDVVHDLNPAGGIIVITCGDADGDLGEGVRTIPGGSDTITMNGPAVEAGADTVAFSAAGEQHAPRA